MYKKISIIILVILMSCNGSDKKKAEVLSSKADSIQTLEQKVKKKSFQDKNKPYKYKYIFIDSINKVSQDLEVNWLTEDTIEFKLLSKNELCDYGFEGIAINKYPKMDSEIDEDENGNSYPAVQYEVIDGGQLFSIRIELNNKSAARINYSYSKPRDECDPESNAVMKITSTNTGL